VETALSNAMTMANRKNYSGSCHCGAVRFSFSSNEIASGCRCNCSICIRKGIVMSEYIPSNAFELDGKESLAVYQFGDKDVYHYFWKICGICPFNGVASLGMAHTARAAAASRSCCRHPCTACHPLVSMELPRPTW
jgi:hypothetical protein